MVGNLSHEAIAFALTLVFSFLVGLEVRSYRVHFHKDEPKTFFGSARTFTFTGMLGYLFALIEPHYFSLYITGMAGLTLLFALFYRRRLEQGHQSILLYLVLLAVYTFGPMTLTYPYWMSALVFVLVVFILNAKKPILHLSEKVDTYEFETLGKMVLLSAVILPLLPDKNITAYLPLSPYKIWLAVVVISAISYGGYLVQRYLFPAKGIFLTGLIGGSYSSTAATVVLARRMAGEAPNPMATGAIVAATAVMYLRLTVIAFVFNATVAQAVLWPFLLFSAMAFVIAFVYSQAGRRVEGAMDEVNKNPLELGTAFVFAALFVIMIAMTHFVTQHYGSGGLRVLSFVVGFTDIDPFILSLLTGKYSVDLSQLYAAILIAAGSNNLLKALYSVWFGGWKNGLHAFVWLLLLGAGTIGVGVMGIWRISL